MPSTTSPQSLAKIWRSYDHTNICNKPKGKILDRYSEIEILSHWFYPPEKQAICTIFYIVCFS